MRIISGKHKGLNLKSFDFDGTRPTTDKVREAIFSKIQFRIFDSNCLDLFGGTGAITIEFLSRGAKKVVVGDNNIKSINLIKENCLKAKENPTIIKGDYKSTLKILKDNNEKFDIIFLDPPYKSDFGQNSIKLIEDYGLLNEDGVLVYECEKNTNIVLNSLKIIDEKIYGTIKVYYIVK